MTDLLTKLTYQTVQQGKRYFGIAHKTLSTELFNWIAPPSQARKQVLADISPALLQAIQRRMDDLLEADWQDAERGVYDSALLFENPWDSFFKVYPALWLDSPSVWARARNQRTQEFAPGIETEGYPQYYVRNFHHQTDGYLSDHSASLYDLQVELLFNGTADAMRRRILAPLQAGLRHFEQPARELRLLDIATGTGRTLKMLRGGFPQAQLFGMDLSAAYLRKANELLSQDPGELPQLFKGNAEALPFQDGYFHGTSCVFLFHELPGPVRQTVINEAFRVTQPGGTFVICDSIQAVDMAELRPVMENFQATFHEPFYRNYIEDSLEERLTQAGFEVVAVFNHFMSKYWVGRRPA